MNESAMYEQKANIKNQKFSLVLKWLHFKKEKGLMDMDNSVVIGEGRGWCGEGRWQGGVRGLNSNRKNTIKNHLKRWRRR